MTGATTRSRPVGPRTMSSIPATTIDDLLDRVWESLHPSLRVAALVIAPDDPDTPVRVIHL